MASRGVHGPNAHWAREDYLRSTAARADSVLLMWYHGAEDVRELRRRGVREFVVRLPDSTAEGGRWKGLEEWGAECERAVQRFWGEGVRRYQLDNEPNLTWPSSARALVDFAWLTEMTALRLRASFWGIELGMAPLAWNPATWRSVEELWVPAQRRALDLFSWAAVHSYYQRPGHYNDPSFGGNTTHWHDVLVPEKELVVTEWGDTSHELGLPPAEVESRRVEGYPRWLEWIDGLPYVLSTHLFILGGTADWAGHWPTDRVLRVL